MFLLQPIAKHAKAISNTFIQASIPKKVAITALLSGVSAIIQSAGGLIPAVGLFISPFATAPIILMMILTVRYGFVGYFLTIFLLFFIQPSEVIVFPFTTGLLGIGIGLSFHILNSRLSIILAGAGALFAGILILMLGLRFPVLGPSVYLGAGLRTFLFIALFSFLYSWIWVELSIFLLKRLRR
ncbi:hypothetical protein EV207_11036 [Scopulibacillus darangshiensis]|uniref:Uncharacterized protein n=2 Tax=Scopulibacillus darangshiensis TaxID=442528 RepID=A0A4R2P6J3_9BACL|nr:hypothetical protein EV207_11036 [Scopulibacillus darangshiensis]